MLLYDFTGHAEFFQQQVDVTGQGGSVVHGSCSALGNQIIKQCGFLR
jgi:hypothetical protein